MSTKFGLKKLDTSLCCMVQDAFWYLEPFKHGSQEWWTDRQTRFSISAL